MPPAPQKSAGQALRDDHGDPGRPAGPQRPDRPGRRGRVRGRIGLGLIAVLVGVFIALSIPRYLGFDSTTGRLSIDEHPLYFPVLIVHLLSATVAIATSVAQVWPWLRRRHPRIHRYVGRVYFIAVWPAALGAVALSMAWPFGPTSALSDIVHSLLWLVAATYGFVLARQGRYADHRRWMLRSFVLTVSIIVNRIITIPITMITIALEPGYDGKDLAWHQSAAGNDSWLGWVIALIALEWWMDREQRPRATSRPAPAVRSTR